MIKYCSDCKYYRESDSKDPKDQAEFARCAKVTKTPQNVIAPVLGQSFYFCSTQRLGGWLYARTPPGTCGIGGRWWEPK